MARPKKEQPYRADGIYEVKVTVGHDLNGKLIRKSFYSSVSKTDARKKAEEYKIKQEITSRTGIIDPADTMTFEKWARKWLEVYKKPHVSNNTYLLTYKNSVEKHIIPYFGKSDLKNIKSIDVQHFFDNKQKELSQSMLDKIHICVMGIFETAIDNDLIYKNPAKNIVYKSEKDLHAKKVWNDEEIQAVKSFFSNNLPEVVLMLDTGIRRGETLGLMWSDVDFENKTLTVQRSVADKSGGGIEVRPPKWESYRTIPISTELCNMLSSLSRTSEYIFPTIGGKAQSPRTWSKKLECHMKAMNTKYPSIPVLTAHELRHTRGTQLRRNGVDIYTIQKLMGHKDINVTANTYVHDEIEVTRKAAKIE